MPSEKMPRRFWSYTAGKGDLYAEERESKRDRFFENFQHSLPGVLALGLVLVFTLVMLMMMFAEFRGFYMDQVGNLLRVR